MDKKTLIQYHSKHEKSSWAPPYSEKIGDFWYIPIELNELIMFTKIISLRERSLVRDLLSSIIAYFNLNIDAFAAGWCQENLRGIKTSET